MRHRNNDVTDEQILSSYDRLGSGPVVARELGVSRPTVYGVLKEHHVTLKHVRPSQRHVKDEEVIQAYRTTWSVMKAAAMVGLSDKTVRDILRDHDEPRTGLDRYRERIRKLTDQDVTQIMAEYAAGQSMAVIAQQRGVTIWTIRHYLTKRGVEIRSKPRMSQSELDAAVKAYQADPSLTVASLARDIGRTEHTLSRAMHTFYPGVMRAGGRTGRRWKGGRHIRRGYVYVFVEANDPLREMAEKSGYAPEHRIVMARSFGRPLRPDETVHHINGDSTDNRVENLQVHTGQHGRGSAAICLDCGSQNIGSVPLERKH